MHTVNELNTIKQESVSAQRSLIDELAERFADVPNAVPAAVLADKVIDFSKEDKGVQLRYCLCAVLAADIATVPYFEGRQSHLAILKQVAESINLSIERIVYLTRYAGLIERHLESIERGEV